MAESSRGPRGARARVVRPAGHRRDLSCGWPGVLCPEHGFTLAANAEWTWCTTADCGRFWLGSHRDGACAEPATVHLAGPEGGDRPLCGEHAGQAARALAAHHPATRHDQAG